VYLHLGDKEINLRTGTSIIIGPSRCAFEYRISLFLEMKVRIVHLECQFSYRTDFF
jgi:hypothetical protein